MLYPCVDDSGEMEGAVVGTDHAVLCGGGWAGGVCIYLHNHCVIYVPRLITADQILFTSE